MYIDEVIGKLRENPNKKFTNPTVEKNSCIAVNGLGRLVWDGKYKTGQPVALDVFYDGWFECIEPVDFLTAVKSGKKIKPVSWNCELDLDDLLYDMSDFESREIREMILGGWYMEEENNDK